MEIVINWGIVTGATVLLAWVVNSGVPLLGRLFKRPIDLSEGVKKAVAFGSAVGLTYAFAPMMPLPDPASDLYGFVGALFLQAESVFKASQEVYDHIWKAFTKKVAKLVRPTP